MVPRIKKILYATDLSASAGHAFGYAADLAQRYDALMTVVYVMENISYYVESQVKDTLGQKQWDKIKSERLGFVTKRIKTRMEEFCSEVGSPRRLVEDIRVTKGNPPEEILKVSKDIKADMIVMGSYGHNILENVLIGSTARKVVKHSEIPVLVVRLPEK